VYYLLEKLQPTHANIFVEIPDRNDLLITGISNKLTNMKI